MESVVGEEKRAERILWRRKYQYAYTPYPTLDTAIASLMYELRTKERKVRAANKYGYQRYGRYSPCLSLPSRNTSLHELVPPLLAGYQELSLVTNKQLC